MEDDQNGRRPKWKTTKMEDDQNGRRPKMKTTINEDDQKLRRPKTKTTKKFRDFWLLCQIIQSENRHPNKDWRRKSCKARIQNSGDAAPKRKTNFPKKEDGVAQKRRQPCPLLIGQTLLACSLCDIFLNVPKIYMTARKDDPIPKMKAISLKKKQAIHNLI